MNNDEKDISTDCIHTARQTTAHHRWYADCHGVHADIHPAPNLQRMGGTPIGDGHSRSSRRIKRNLQYEARREVRSDGLVGKHLRRTDVGHFDDLGNKCGQPHTEASPIRKPAP